MIKIVIIALFAILVGSCRFADDSTGPGIPGHFIYEVGRVSTPGKAYAIDVYGHKVYVADGSGGLTVIDVLNQHYPFVRHSVSTGDIVWDVKYDGNNKAYVADSQSGIKAFDVNYPMGPEVISSFNTSNALGLDLSGNYLFLADGNGGFRIFDVSAPYHITQVSNITNLVTQPVFSVTVKAGYAYLCSRYGFEIIDISNINNPHRVSFETMDYVYDVEIVGNNAFFATQSGLRVYNIGNPDDPRELGIWFSPDTARAVKIRGDYAFVAVGQQGLSIVNIEDINFPYEVTYFNPFGAEISDVYLQGNSIFLAAGDEGVIIIEFNP